MQVSLHNKVKVYNLTAGRSLPEWLADRKNRKKRAAAGEENRVELIHDMEFPHFSRCIFRSENGSYLFAAGDYPPRIKCFDVNQLSLKFSFNADMPIEGGVALSPDFRKFALRGQGRMITVHNASNIVDRIRVPHAMRGMIYEPHLAELLTCGSDAVIHRLSLESGAFAEPFHTASSKGISAVDTFRSTGLLLASCENGTVEAWDPRAATRAATLVVSRPGGDAATASAISLGDAAVQIEPGFAATHVSTDPRGGLLIAVGTGSGCVALYDVRSSRPVSVRDHRNGLPIVKTAFFEGRSSGGDSTHVLSADARGVRIWSRADGSLFTSLDAPAELYDFAVLRAQHNMAAPYQSDDSGVICMCCDTPRVQVAFVPQLGVAPRWCSFLDSITEELEEKGAATVVYDGFDFVSSEEMQDLGLNPDDMADGKVRPYMHGFLIDSRLHRELKAFVDPSAFSRYVQDKSRERRQERVDNRISSFRRKDPVEAPAAAATPVVDGDGADAAERRAPTGGMSKVKQNIHTATSDPRFSTRLEEQAERFGFDKKNPEFMKMLQTIDERKAVAATRHHRYEASQFEIVRDEEGEDKDEKGAGDRDDGSSDEEAKLARTELHQHPAAARRLAAATKAATPAAPAPAAATTTMFAAVKGANVTASDRQIHESRKRGRERKLTLEERLRKRASSR